MKLRRLIPALAVILAGLLSGSAGAQAPASHRATGSFFTFHTANGNHYAIGQPNVAPGNMVIQVTGQGQELFFSDTTSFNGDPAGTLQFSNGDFAAANTACTGITIKASSTASGTIFGLRDAGNNLVELTNRFCDAGNGPVVLYADNIAGHQWKLCTDGIQTNSCLNGEFWKLVAVP